MFLPTSYQWEFACRAGCGARLYNGQRGSDAAALNDLGWHFENNSDDPDWYYEEGTGRCLPHVVGLKTPNVWGLYDMLGNVEEVCADVWSATPIQNADGTPVVDPIGPWVSPDTATVYHPARGGYLLQSPNYLCASYQNNATHSDSKDYRGFRLVCDVEVSR